MDIQFVIMIIIINLVVQMLSKNLIFIINFQIKIIQFQNYLIMN